MLYCLNDRDELSQGTGFFYKIMVGSECEHFILTNKHVVRSANGIGLRFSLLDKNGKMLVNKYFDQSFRDMESIIHHPNPKVDLCAIPITKLVKLAKRKKCILAMKAFSNEDLLVDSHLKELSSFEEIIMAGYPSGLGDNFNNLPITVKGTTATDINMNFEGKKDFVANITGWNGNSGSPVTLLKKTYQYEKNKIQEDERLMLAGVMYLCWDYVNIIQLQKHILYTNLPSNLLIVLKAQRIKELAAYIVKQADCQIAA